MAFWPPVSAMSGTGSPSRVSRSARMRWMPLATAVEPVNITPWTRASPTRARPTAPSPGRIWSASSGTPAACRIRTASAAMSGVSSAGLARTGLPAARAAATCPTKIAQREVPGCDAGDRPERRVRRVERPLGLGRVVAQEVDGLADLRDRVGVGLPGLADDQSDQHRHPGLEGVGGPAQASGPFGPAGSTPRRRRPPEARATACAISAAVAARQRPTTVPAIGRVAHGGVGRTRIGSCRHGPPDRSARSPRRPSSEAGERGLVGEIEPGRVGAGRLRRGRAAARSARAARPGPAHRLDRGDRIGDQRLDRHGRVGDPVDEGGVGAVLQEAPDQVGEQGLVRAHRRVDAARPPQPSPRRPPPRRAARPSRGGTGTRTGRAGNPGLPSPRCWRASARCGWRIAGTPRRARRGAGGRRRGTTRRCGPCG